ncbi:MAG TPA: hypothetical protein VFQ39_11800 [Longimicrobium sp.]|nr:hypothetical protein [Longimicrobium sp.]
MKKLSLAPDALEVQSFATSEGDAARGTVRAHTGNQDTCVGANTCAPGCTDVDTCPAVTCAATCPASCVSCPVSCYPAQCPSSDGRC